MYLIHNTEHTITINDNILIINSFFVFIPYTIKFYNILPQEYIIDNEQGIKDPIGMSGARIVLHLANELKRRGGGTGAAALCGGGGQGDALIIRVP